MSLARQLAERITALHYDALPPEAVYWGKIAVLDTLGVALAGAAEAAPKFMRQMFDLQTNNGPSLIFGTTQRVQCLDATLVNATAAHALDFDNTSNYIYGHESAAIIPALLAAGEAFAANGRDLLLAYVAGFETAARIASAVTCYHTDKGWHSTSTLGVFGVAAACARLLGLSVAETEMALALSTSLAAGTKSCFGTMANPLHAGQCSRNGLMAVLLARKGFTANPDAFEHKQGFFNVFNGPGHYDAARAIDGWGVPLSIVTPGASYKQYPCCYSTHGAVDAAMTLHRQHGPFDADRVARIGIWIPVPRLTHTDRPDPQNGHDAIFSVQYCVARALLEGEVVLEQFEGNAYRDPLVCSLLPRIHTAPFTDKPFSADDLFDAKVEITLTNGKVLSAGVDRPLGRTSDYPIAHEQLEAKFRDCALRVLAPEAVASVSRMIGAFEQVASLRDFTAMLEPNVSPT